MLVFNGQAWFTNEVKKFAEKLERAKRESTAHLLFKCARLLNDVAVATLPTGMAGDLRAAHLALFPHIELEGGTRVTELAAKLGISKQAVGQLVDDLEAFGAVERLPDRKDGRAKRVCFTSKGRASMLQGLAHLKSLEPGLRRALGRDTMKNLHHVLLILHDHLRGV